MWAAVAEPCASSPSSPPTTRSASSEPASSTCSAGIETYLIDNESTDATVEIAARFELAGLETAPRHGVYSWRPLLERKEALAETLDADWFIHLDADEIRLPPRSSITLAEAIAEVDALGYNAVDFQEFTFVPTVEAPDHDHPRFQETMRHYYAYSPGRPDRLNAWKRQDARVDLAASGGHQVSFAGLNAYPHMFPMRHYLYLSAAHAVSKYVEREYDPARSSRAGTGGVRRFGPTT